jgi:hypothetical protein
LAEVYIIYKYFYSLAAVGVFIIIIATGPRSPPRNQDLPAMSVVGMLELGHKRALLPE